MHPQLNITTDWVSHKKPWDGHNGYVCAYGLQLVFKHASVYNCFQKMCITRSPQWSKSHCQVKYSQTWFSGLEIVRKDQSPSPWWCQTSHCAWNHWKNTNASLQKKPSKVLQLGETTDLKALLQFDNHTKLSKGCWLLHANNESYYTFDKKGNQIDTNVKKEELMVV
jgi:hypothetical protein